MTTLNNAAATHRVDGSGPPLVFVPGVGPDSNVAFGHLVGEFTGDGRSVIRVDYADTGDEPLTIEALAEQIAGEIAAATEEPVDLVGFSLGSCVVATVAATRPELVRSLVVAAGWVDPSDEYLRTMMAAWRRVGEFDVDAFGRLGAITAFSPAFLNQLGRDAVEGIATNTEPSPLMSAQLDLILRMDIGAYLEKIDVPTLVLGGSQDRTIPVANARAVHDAVAGSEYAELDTGHVMQLEKPAEFTRALRDFLPTPDAKSAASSRPGTGVRPIG